MLNLGDDSEQNPFSHSSSEWDFSTGECSVLECAHLGYSRLKDDETREAVGCQEMSGMELSRVFFLLFCFFFSSLTCSSPPFSHGCKQPVWSGFRFACCWSHHRWLIVPPLNLSLVFSRSLSLCPSFRKCWTSAKTEGAVKSLSTAACLGQTSVLAAVNTSLSGTNADLVSPSSPHILTATPHLSLPVLGPFFLFSHTPPHSVRNSPGVGSLHLH